MTVKNQKFKCFILYCFLNIIFENRLYWFIIMFLGISKENLYVKLSESISLTSIHCLGLISVRHDL